MRALAHQCFGPLVTQEACATTGASLILVGVVLLSWKVGAATPVAVIKDNQELKNELPGLSEASGLIGSDQIQNRASLGGNLCTASPGAGSDRTRAGSASGKTTLSNKISE